MKRILSFAAAIAAAVSLTVSGAGAGPLAKAPGLAAGEIAVPDVVKAGGRSGFYSEGGHVYLNGHRGWRTYRRGFVGYGGYWFPPGAFGFTIIIGPSTRYYGEPRGGYEARPRLRLYDGHAGISVEHYRWCDARYRSYRASDDTFQPYHGPRRRCRSPYGR